MRHLLPLLPVLLLGACAGPPREPGLAAYRHILQAARDARQACAGLGPGCGPRSLDAVLARAEAEAPRDLLLPPGQAAAERPLAEAAFQAAFADCRGRGLTPGTPRFDSCRVDRAIARLNEVAGLR